MADDVAGLMDALDLAHAHLVGASMGGFIAQTLAITHPERVLSLTSLMATTGDGGVGQPHPAALRELFGGPPGTSREAAAARAVRLFGVVGSPGFPVPAAEAAERAGRAWDRDHDDAALARQAVAVVVSGDRTPGLRGLRLPTLVVHGLADTMCDPSGGRATAAAVPGAELLLIDGMGHNLPAGVWERIADRIAGVVRRAEAARGGSR